LAALPNCLTKFRLRLAIYFVEPTFAYPTAISFFPESNAKSLGTLFLSNSWLPQKVYDQTTLLCMPGHTLIWFFFANTPTNN
jgi:hypothetical protein